MPAPVVHADFAAASALAAPNEQRATALIEIGFGERKRFLDAQPGSPEDHNQAADTLLDAIARSDGTRASVLEQLRRTREPRGLVGEIGFDARGDMKEGADTIVRVVGGKRGTGIASLSGAVVEDVIPVSPAMVE